MSIKKTKYLLLIFLSVFFSTNAQNENEEIILNRAEHLFPLDGILNSYDFQFEYYSDLRKSLLKGLSDSPKIQYLSTPSFSTEYVLHINDSIATYRKAINNIWYSKNTDSTNIEKYKSPINKESIELLQNLYRKAIKKTKYQIIEPENSNNLISGNDGTTYLFSVYNFGIKSGKTWSPKEGTKLFDLVQINEEIIEKIKISKGKPIKINGRLKRKIHKLIEYFSE
ncbi:hypothetical protein [uncultured Lacinutrix sp.]|uniref:hypothetical protein n=1 Tax=uncultured Lacinutrix sp. TaxID=574032 RepID=UPI00260A2465|nr:hypothetical protein [uncultured Lacinutrix sp.]